MTKYSGLKVFKILLVLILCKISVYCQYVCDNPNSTVAGTDYCYTFHNETLDWIAAREFCAAQNGQLPIITDSVTSSALRDLLRRRGEADSWLGGRADHRDSYDWFWISDGSPIDSQGCYDDVFLSHDLVNEYTVTPFTDITCINECSNPPDSRGPHLYAGVQSQGACYCGNDYGRNSDYALVGGCGQACVGDPSRGRCGGALRNAIYLLNGSYADWSNDEPDGQICGVIDEEVQNKRLYADEHCNSQFAFICQIGDSGSCPTDTGYRITAGRCYYVSSTNNYNWFQAQEECFQKGGNLVKISDETERQNIEVLLQNLGATDPHWIGLTRMKWMWNTSAGAEEALSYTDWSSILTPPVMSIPVGHNFCLINSATDDYKWFSEECYQNVSVVCQHRTVEMTTTQSMTESIPDTSVEPSETSETESVTNTIGPIASTVPAAETSVTEGDMISPSQSQNTGTSSSTLDQRTSGSLISALSSSTPSASGTMTEEIASETTVTELVTYGNNEANVTDSPDNAEESTESDNNATGTDNTTSGEGTPKGPQTGASSGNGNDDKLSTFQIVLIVTFCILGLLLLVTAVVAVYIHKKKGYGGFEHNLTSSLTAIF